MITEKKDKRAETILAIWIQQGNNYTAACSQQSSLLDQLTENIQINYLQSAKMQLK